MKKGNIKKKNLKSKITRITNEGKFTEVQSFKGEMQNVMTFIMRDEKNNPHNQNMTSNKDKNAIWPWLYLKAHKKCSLV